MMFIEQAAYVGDVLSFYLDNQFQENFIQYARQTNNIFELAYMFGYKPKTTGVAQTTIDFYQQVPSKTVGGISVPDYDYTLNIPDNTSITSQNGISFIIEEGIDFSTSSSLDPTEVSVYQISGNTPQYYLLKKSRKAISATIKTQSFSFTDPIPFNTIDINESNIVGILDIIDSDGNKWYEVDHLGQETVYRPIPNNNINNPNNTDPNDTQYVLKLEKIQRRFSTRFTSLNNLQIQFGSGNSTDSDEEIVPNPNNVGIGLPFGTSKLTAAYSPSNYLYTSTYGISPSNTTLTIRYLTGGGVSSNIEANTLTSITTTNIKFNNSNLNSTTANYVFSSIAATNPIAASGGKGGDTLEEIRQNTLSLISSQNRAVTQDDYLIRALSMPSRFGSISKAYIEKPKLTDNQASTIETLNLYCLSKNLAGNLDYPSEILKSNLRTYLMQNRMIGDYIEIKDAYIINIAINFEIIVLPEYNNNEVLLNCILTLRDYFNIDKWQINQPIILRELYINLDKVEGVQTVKNIIISNKAGQSLGYSPYAYDINGATQNQIIYPSLDPSIFEVRYPELDIKGKVVPL